MRLTDDQGIAYGDFRNDIQWNRRCYAEPFALADRIVRESGMLAQRHTTASHDFAWLEHLSRVPSEKIAIIVSSQEAQILRILTRGRRQPMLLGDLANFGLGVIPDWEQRVL